MLKTSVLCRYLLSVSDLNTWKALKSPLVFTSDVCFISKLHTTERWLRIVIWSASPVTTPSVFTCCFSLFQWENSDYLTGLKVDFDKLTFIKHPEHRLYLVSIPNSACKII